MFSLSYTLQLVMLGTFFLGVFGGFLGSILVLQRKALIGDALAHATLPGVMLAFLLFSTRSLNVLLIGAFISALIAYALMNFIKNKTVIQWDTAMALMLAGFFGFGQWLLSIIQRRGSASQAGLSRFIFGDAATMLRADVQLIAIFSIILLLFMLIILKDIKLYIFDPTYYASMRRSKGVIEMILSLTTLIFIILGIRLVGVVLISALLIGPVLIARQWTNRFCILLLLASVIGGLSGAFGTYLSATRANVPTGPVIVLLLGSVFIISLLFAPKQGVVQRFYKRHMLKKNLVFYKSVIHLYENPKQPAFDNQDLNLHQEKGLVTINDNQWTLTYKGEDKIKQLKRMIEDEY